MTAPAAAHNPGGRVLSRPPSVVKGEAIFAGPANCYRHYLGWEAAEHGCGKMVAVLMNPSTADADVGDATVNKLWRIATRMGFGLLCIGNVFAYRSTSPTGLLTVDDPVGPENEMHLLAMTAHADLIVIGYGQQKAPKLRQQGPAMARLLLDKGRRLHAFRVGAGNTPWHPLYITDATTPQPWTPA